MSQGVVLPTVPEVGLATGDSAASSQTAAAKPRNQIIDVIRLIAAAGIVYVHAVRHPVLENSRQLFRFAVPFYLFASFYFQSASLRRRSDRTLGGYILARIKRLYLPFLAWSVIYLVARDLKRHFLEHQGPVRLEVGLLWRGIEYHLWFLPFLLAFSILLAVIYWTFLRQQRSLRWPLIGLAVAAGLYFSRVPKPSWNQTFDNPFYAYFQYWRALPAACWGLAFAWLMTMGEEIVPVNIIAGFAGVLLTVGTSIYQYWHGIQQLPRALSGLGAILAALAPWKAAVVPLLARIGRWSFGIYLCHVLVTEFVRSVASHLHFHESVSTDLLIFAAAMVGSAIVVLSLSFSRYLAWLNG